MRRSDTTTDNFRRLVREIASMMAYEATRDLPTEPVSINTPVASCEAPMISGKKLCLVSILRAGNGMLDGMIDLLPGARVGHVGLYRDPTHSRRSRYYYKVPDDIEDRLVIVVDPMLATGNSASAALAIEGGRRHQPQVRVPAGGPEGLAALVRQHRTCRSPPARSTATLNDHGYIVPGLGDAGDRIFGTQ